ncbi:MAG TPA: hypothetical protein VGP93_16125 [Polyangiaceae bacterium]|jgi:hypothetical protein|nr:hypothetical protein [Polyangiaceae bacterium]
MQWHWGSIALCAALVAASSGCDVKEQAKDLIKEQLRDDPSQPTAAASSPAAPRASATASAAPAPSAAASVAAQPAASASSAPPSLAELFDGPASDALEKGKRVQASYGGRGTTVGVPAGWKADTEQNAGLIQVVSDDGTAAYFMHDYMGGVTNGSVNFWSNRAGFKSKGKVTWDPQLVDGKYGAAHLAVKVGTAHGELAKKPATFFHVRLPDDILVAGAVDDDAPAARRQELIDAMKSLRPKEKKPKPEQ